MLRLPYGMAPAKQIFAYAKMFCKKAFWLPTSLAGTYYRWMFILSMFGQYYFAAKQMRLRYFSLQNCLAKF
jgi:hypothetical protein